ncbi:MAG: DUF89 family protein [Phycisphaerae bacterium]|nr:DUF89 family protein [Phycisphaerae bacterium]
MAIFCQLMHPDRYRVSNWNVMDDPEIAAYWLNLFATFPERFDRQLVEDNLAGENFEQRWPAFRVDYDRELAALQAEAEKAGVLQTIDLTRFRQRLVSKYGFPDPYEGIKRRENRLAAELYPRIVAQLEATPLSHRWDLLLRGILAGNMFDLGSPDTIAMYQRGEVDFLRILANVPPRPWFVDHADAVRERLARNAWRKAMFFVDNAGTDIVLGVLPLARQMALCGTRVVLAPNSKPALNDITLAELVPLLEDLCGRDPELRNLVAGGMLTTVASGGDTPLIDLGQVSEECNAAAADIDLLVLEGMGRGVESNWTEEFKCDVWRVAMLKDRAVVKWMRASLFDPVCRLDAKR